MWKLQVGGCDLSYSASGVNIRTTDARANHKGNLCGLLLSQINIVVVLTLFDTSLSGGSRTSTATRGPLLCCLASALLLENVVRAISFVTVPSCSGGMITRSRQIYQPSSGW